MPRLSIGYASKRKLISRRKRVARRKSAPSRNKSGINNNPFLSLVSRVAPRNTFPPSMRRTLKYCEVISMSSGTGLLGTQQAYLLNSIYDTNSTGAGHQPYGHDTLATIYNKYRVVATRVQIVFTTPGGASDMICVMAPSANTSAGMTNLQLYQVQEWPQSTCGILPSDGERRCVLQQTYDMSVQAGVSKAVYLAGDEYEAVIGASPSKSVFLTFNVGCVDGTGSQACKAHVLLEFDVIFFDRITLGLS